ncbi:MAG: signal peptidase II [Gemmatimonadaceae bacterium]
MRSRSNAALFWPMLVVVLVVDVVTKAIVERALLRGIPQEVLGNTLRLRLVYNPGAAFGVDLGPQSRWIFATLTIVALVILARLYRSTLAGHSARVAAIALVCAGALGNLIDRVRSFFGVVDFIDLGIGDSRWPTFNVADMAVSIGAGLLAWVLWQEDQSTQGTASAVAPVAVPASASGGEPGDLV